ncbi:MAG: DNA recombination protein RmuC, partial [Chitinophagales bacterium]
MSETIVLYFFPLGALIFGLLLGYFYSKSKSESNLKTSDSQLLVVNSELEYLKRELEQTRDSLSGVRNEKEQVSIALARQENESQTLLSKLGEQKGEIERLQEQFTKDFELLANKILEEKTNKFTEQNKENLKTILSPLQEKIQLFEKKVEDTHKESIGFNAALHQQIRNLREVHEQMSKETLNLTKALKGDSKMQGNWGEMILEKVLEKSGLEKDREYFVQKSFDTA